MDNQINQINQRDQADPLLAVQWFPPLGSAILVEIDTIAHTARVPSQEFVVPHLISGPKLLEPLRVTESAGHIVLRNLTDTRFEFFHSGMAARQ